MTEINFYHLQSHPLEQALPKLLEKVVGAGFRVVVLSPSKARLGVLNAALWTYDPGTFLPHGSAVEGHASEQPVWLTDSPENPNEASVLVLTDGVVCEVYSEYEKCLDLFDGNDPQAEAAARHRWKAYRDDGHKVTYYQQDARGGWEQKS
ncbi:MAG: DNA polymerase III subunit chi [Rhodospirillaceae bacterium]|jgi:DNA polymerase III subunit chi|nr:DNA polymerase III subunit chi [Rhodospirillaceae bacterium]MBT5658680.1 DNA polymerase III subunit chi [Rhodospirillaceae bacterium]MBT5751223.1 DNA polymerase III subunit chi [Rhodospirillaceae bacterium]